MFAIQLECIQTQLKSHIMNKRWWREQDMTSLVISSKLHTSSLCQVLGMIWYERSGDRIATVDQMVRFFLGLRPQIDVKAHHYHDWSYNAVTEPVAQTKGHVECQLLEGWMQFSMGWACTAPGQGMRRIKGHDPQFASKMYHKTLTQAHLTKGFNLPEKGLNPRRARVR